jgi:hypothetical protein
LLRRGVLDTTLCDQVCQWLAAGRWFSPDIPVSSTNKTDRHDITEILLKVALNTINQAKPNYMLGVSTLSVFGFFYQILAPEFIPSFFSGVRVTRSFVLYVCSVDRCLFFCTFSFGHLVCFSSICGL